MEQEQLGDLVRYTKGSLVWEGVVISKNVLKFTKTPVNSFYKIGDLFDFIPPLCKTGDWEVIGRYNTTWEEKMKIEKRTRFISRIEKRHVQNR